MPLSDSTSAPVAPQPLEEAIHSTSAEVLKSVAADPALSVDLALALLKRSDVPSEALEQLSKNAGVMKSRKAKLALLEHAKTPRHISLPMVPHLFTFDLVRVALTPVTPADIKLAADETLIKRLESIPQGQRLSLARRASGRVAAELLLDNEPRVIRTALENSRLVESSVIRGLMRGDAPAAFVEATCHHAKWSARQEVRVALLRNEKTPLARALEFARSLPPALVREVLHGSRLPANIKSCLLKSVQPQN